MRRQGAALVSWSATRSNSSLEPRLASLARLSSALCGVRTTIGIGCAQMNHPLRCRCGTLQGFVLPSATTTRAICYCKDCQAYARFLRTPGVIDSCGGTEVVASLPKHVHFIEGQGALACLSLSPRGILRWYAECCNTPIGNTPRNSKISYVGLVHSCLEAHSPSLESSFGPLRMAVSTKSAIGKVRSTPAGSVIGVLTLMKALLGARLSGSYRDNPFFLAGSGTPSREPYVLSKAEREQAYRSAA